MDPLSRPKIVGAPVQRLEDPRMLTGSASYVDDRRLPGTLHVALRRSEHAHARILGIDTAAAARLPGVVAVLTAADIDDAVAPLRATSRMKDYHSTPVRPLAGDKVRYVGEAVAAVVAESRYLAEDALEHIVVEFEPLAALVDAEAALERDAPLLHEEAGTNVLVARSFSRGEPERALAANSAARS